MASYTKVTNTVSLPVSFDPQTAFPLDARSMFGSYEEAVAAAASAENAGSSNTVYYIGMPLTVYENDEVTMYNIQPDKTLKKVGTVPVGDNVTITVGTDGKVAMKSFGKEYYAYIPADNIISGTYTYPGIMPENPSEGDFAKAGSKWYKYSGTSWAEADDAPKESPSYALTQGWKDGLQPKVNLNDGIYELAWYEPSSTTVEGLSSSIASVQTRVSSVERSVNTLNGDVNTEGSVKKQIADAVAAIMNNPDETMNSIQELVDWISANGTDATNMNTRITTNSTNISNLTKLIGSLPEGITATTVIGYIQEAVKAEGDKAVKEVKASATNGHISVDGADVKVYELPNASTTTSGGVKVDGTSITVSASTGVASVAAVDKSKVTGLSDMVTEAQANAVTEANQNTADNYVAKTSVIDSESGTEGGASDKVFSEKAIIDMLTWKTSM